MSLKTNKIKKETEVPAVKRALLSVASKERAKINAWFFKTGNGDYGEGDKFIGVRVPEQRKVAKKFLDIDFLDLRELLFSNVHEYRFTALVILVDKYLKADKNGKEKVVNFYLKNIDRVNNWDLVDVSAYKILGDYCLRNKRKKILFDLVKNENFWHRRIAIVSTFAFIRDGNIDITLKISKKLLKDKEDLIHKASGWMLREVGKKNKKELEKFLNENLDKMPRTMLRYSIEKFSKDERRKYLKK